MFFFKVIWIIFNLSFGGSYGFRGKDEWVLRVFSIVFFDNFVFLFVFQEQLFLILQIMQNFLFQVCFEYVDKEFGRFFISFSFWNKNDQLVFKVYKSYIMNVVVNWFLVLQDIF